LLLGGGGDDGAAQPHFWHVAVAAWEARVDDDVDGGGG
jgi:hypothetical protein